MNTRRKHFRLIGRLAWLVLILLVMRPSEAGAAVEETFDVLQIGTRSYTNVTVTTKAKNYIFILHAAGMTNLRVTELPPEIQQKLGYAAGGAIQKHGDLPSHATSEHGPAKELRKGDPRAILPWAKNTIAKTDIPQLKRAEQMWHDRAQGKIPKLSSINPKLLYAALGIGVLAYVFFCQCSRLICLKAGAKPGVLVWLPVLQTFPLLSAAGMSPFWFLLCLVPGLGLVVQIVWSIKIAKKCGKGAFVAFLLIVPGVNLFGFVYLAFSNAVPAAESKKTGSQTMVLGAA